MLGLFLYRSRGALRRLAIALSGGAVLIVGLFLIPLPGPGLLIVPLGLGILALEFPWAARWLQTARSRAAGAWSGPQRARDSVARMLRGRV
jgi:uncharacterized protein (TIGR02611 family)